MVHEPYVVLSESAQLLATETALSDLQRAQLLAAARTQALQLPGAEIELLVSIGGLADMPRFSGPVTAHDQGEIIVGSYVLQSTAGGGRQPASEGNARNAPTSAAAAGQRLQRWIRLGHADATPATTQSIARRSLPRRVYGVLERRTPLLVDVIRETVMTRRARQAWQPMPRFPEGSHDQPLADVLAAAAEATVPALPTDAAPAILFGMHWLQPSGAERWAIESIRIAKEQGFLPIVVTDHDSVHSWMTRPELAGCVIVALTETDQSRGGLADTDVLRGIVGTYQLRGVMVHHSAWLYRVLPLLKKWRPMLPVVDSLHTVEYLGGGYPGYATRFDHSIDTHHTISPELSRWLHEVQGIATSKLVMAPLTELTVYEELPFRARSAEEPFTLVFVGRLSRDKRPDAFLALVHRLRRDGLPVRAILHGDGELSDLVEGMLDRFRLRGVVERRLEDRPVSDTLAEAHLLVTTSMLEGLPLTTFEAVSAGVPVTSVDLGSQRTIVQPELLLPRPLRAFVRAAHTQIVELIASESQREAAWKYQRTELSRLMLERSAHRFTKELFESWQA